MSQIHSLWSGASKQFGRVIAVRFLDVAGKAIGRLNLSNGCSFDPDRFQQEVEDSLPSWLSAGISLASARLWKTVGLTRMNLELTPAGSPVEAVAIWLGQKSGRLVRR